MNSFFNKIISWYNQNQRQLPWRDTKNPYMIWLSEIILQQTRVEQGLPYYYKFTENFPTVSDLANADEEQILKLWQGLGYYSRARNLHFTAKIIRDQYNGIFPSTYTEILNLKGIGEYTAAAIASFSFNLPHAVIDGNVYRVLSRVFDIDTPIDSSQGRKIFKEIANDILIKDTPGLFNQAIMEFGSLQCTPAKPNCEICPIKEHCLAFQKNTIKIRPVKANKVKVSNRYFYYFLYCKNDTLFIKKRQAKDIWNGLYDFPLIEEPNPLTYSDILSKFNISSEQVLSTHQSKHILSHQHIYATFIQLNFQPPKQHWCPEWQLIQLDDLTKYPLPRMLDKFLQEVNLLTTSVRL